MSTQLPARSPRAVIYTRVSTNQQEEGTSLAAQFAACSKKAQELGLEVGKHLEETESGGLYLGRAKLQQALSMIESGEASALVVYKLDRTGRDVDNLRDIRRRIEKAGGQLIFADGMQFDKSAVGNLMFTQLGAFAEFERETIRERTVRGSRNRAQSGIMPVRARRPYGYRFVSLRDIENGTHAIEQLNQYEVVEEEARWVRFLFEQYLAGHGLHTLCTLLQEQGVSTLRGAPYWRPTAVRNLLRNPLYKGRPAYGKYEHGSDEARRLQGWNSKYRRPRPAAEWIYFHAPAVVSEEMWEACNRRMLEAKAKYSGRKDLRRLLTSIIRCPQCGSAMRYQAIRSTTYKVKDGSRRTLRRQKANPYYRCARERPPEGYYLQQHNEAEAPIVPEPCKGYFNADWLHAWTLGGLQTIVRRPEIVQEALAVSSQAQGQDTRVKGRAAEEKQLHREADALRKRINATMDLEIEARVAGRDTRAYRERLEKMENQLKSIEARLVALRSTKEQKEALLSSAQLVNQSLKNVDRVLTAPPEKVSDEEKNRLLMQLVIKVVPDGQEGCTVYLRTPSAAAAAAAAAAAGAVHTEAAYVCRIKGRQEREYRHLISDIEIHLESIES